MTDKQTLYRFTGQDLRDIAAAETLEAVMQHPSMAGVPWRDAFAVRALVGVGLVPLNEWHNPRDPLNGEWPTELEVVAYEPYIKEGTEYMFCHYNFKGKAERGDIFGAGAVTAWEPDATTPTSRPYIASGFAPYYYDLPLDTCRCQTAV